VAKEDDDQQADSRRAPASEANALALAARSTDSLRRSRALMGEELEKGRRTLAAMEESRATMRKTGDEYAGDQRAALAGGGRLLSRLEKQAVWERRTLWCGFVCFMLAAAHVVLKRTPVLVRFHPLWWIRHAAVRKAKQAAKAAAAEAKAAKTLQAPTPTPLAAAAAGGGGDGDRRGGRRFGGGGRRRRGRGVRGGVPGRGGECGSSRRSPGRARRRGGW
jgi:protein transport protein SEC20